MIFNLRILALFAATSLVLSNVVAGEGQPRDLRNHDNTYTRNPNDPCTDLNPTKPCKTLEDLVRRLRTIVPHENTEEYRIPKKSTLEGWQEVVDQMLKGKCQSITLPEGLKDRYKLYRFVDKKADDAHKHYCVLASTIIKNNKARYAWGTFITRIRQRTEKEKRLKIYNLSIDVPHPWSDYNTYIQGVHIYKNSQARSMYLAGAHRKNRPEKSKCDGKYHVSDASHEYNHPLTYTTMAVRNFYTSKSGRDFAVIQVHGKGEKTCPKSHVFIADGGAVHGDKNKKPGPVAEKFRQELKQQFKNKNKTKYKVNTVNEDKDCILVASRNVQARIVNDFINPTETCNFNKNRTGKWIEEPNGRFLQFEQSLSVRDDNALYSLYGKAIRNTFSDAKYYRTAA